MSVKKWAIGGLGSFVLLVGLALAFSGEFSKKDAIRQLDRVFSDQKNFIYGPLHLLAGSGPPIKEDQLDIAIGRVGKFIEASEAEAQRLRSELGEAGMKQFLSPFNYEQLGRLRQTWLSGFADKAVFQKSVINGGASAGVRVHLKPNAKAFCQDYQEGINNACQFAVARWRVDKITGVRDGVERGAPAKVVEFEASSEPTAEGQKYVDQRPEKGSFIAAFVEYDDGWRLAVGPFRR